MSVQVDVNGTSINYPQTGDTGWGDEATQFAIQVGGAFSKLGLDTGTTIDIPGTLDVTQATTLDSTLDVDGATQLNSTVTIVDDLAVDTDTLFVDVSADRVGINITSPSEALDVVGNIKSSGSITGSSATLTNLTVDTDLIKTDSTNNRVGINTTTPTKALDVTGEILASSDITTGGLLIADDSTSTSAPPITFTGDTNTGIGRSGADTLDFITGGNSRFRIESTGQIKAVYESQVGTDYNTQLDNGYLCRAWVNFNGTGTVAIHASGNVSSITDNGTGDYTVNFTNAMPDVNYSIFGSCVGSGSASAFNNYTAGANVATPKLTGSIRFTTIQVGTLFDSDQVSIGVFR